MQTIENLYQAFLSSNQSICIDSREIKKGDFFFALKGANFNGNDFAAQALRLGAAYVVVDEEQGFLEKDKCFLVQDSLKSLQELARHHRRTLNTKIIGITGSNGKTSTKELMAAVLNKKYNCHYTIGNFNNHIGVPLTLLQMRKEHEVAVIEMGANHVGEIELLCNISEPNIGLITNIGRAHLEGFGSVENIKIAKGELYKFLLSKNGIVVQNGDDSVLKSMLGVNPFLNYGLSDENHVSATILKGTTGMFLSFEWFYKGESKGIVNTQLFGGYNLYNCLAAISIGILLEIEPDKISEAIASYAPSLDRSQVKRTKRNLLVVDAYNANPSSMKLAIEEFLGTEEKNKTIIIGDMMELGEDSDLEHERILQVLFKEKSNIQVILIGKLFAKIADKLGWRVESYSTVVEFVASGDLQNINNRLIILKGSRSLRLEALVPYL